jgi:nucleotide-binding universal stress UspA family protein
MFRSILVPLDGSVFAEHALPMAVSLARRCGAALRVLRVVPPLADYFFWAPLPGDPIEAELRQLHQTEAKNYLDGVEDRLKDAGVGPISCDVLEEEVGISESIATDTAKTGTDLVVLTSHGRGAVARVWLGSIADKLVRTLPVPVLLVRPSEHPPLADLHRQVQLKHILLALDGTPLAERILEPALTIGKAMVADFTLIRVIRPVWLSLSAPTPVDSSHKPPLAWTDAKNIDDKQRQNAEAYLQQVAERLRAGGVSVQTRVYLAEQPAAAILEEASVGGADLIALETHGRGGIPRLWLGSVADKVVRGSALPVLVCRLGC